MKNSYWVAAFTAGILSTSIGTTFAADMALKARPLAEPTWSWTGFYVGANGGYGVANDRFSQAATGSFTGGGLPRQEIATLGSTNALDGGFFGVQGGYNYQTGSTILGVEGDLQWARQTGTGCGLHCNMSSNPFSGSDAFTVDQRINFFGTLRGRVGWTPVDGAMIYATGGGAWMAIDKTDGFARTSNNPAGPAGTATASSSNVTGGFAVGAGAEFRVWGNWTAKLEYLHLDVSGTTTSSVLAAPGAFGPLAVNTTTGRIKDDIFRVGLNYRLGQGALAASTSPSALIRKAPAIATVWNWSGFYVGANAGYGVAHDQFVEVNTNAGPIVQGSSRPSSIAPTGGIFGLQGGYNYQAGSAIIGIEGDWQWTNQGATSCGADCSLATGAFPGSVTNYFSRQQDVKWFATARGRVGWTPVSGVMVYATGGAAWMGVSETDVIRVGDTINGFDNLTANFSNTKSGYAVGAGTEFLVSGNWTAKVEYLHLDVGGTTTAAFQGQTIGGGTRLTTTTTNRIKDDIARVGLNYHFAGPVVATY